MTTPSKIAVFRCERCERKVELPAPVLDAPECGQYTPGTKQRFPDGSWIMLGEGYTPHGPMTLVDMVDANPFQKQADAASERRALLRATGAALAPVPEGMFSSLPRSTDIDEPRGANPHAAR